MGTIRNEMTIVHHYDKDELEKVREDAIKVFSQVIRQDEGVEEYIENMITPIMKTYINQEYTFIINGDCSKIGWETSERFHQARMKWCEKHKHDVQNIMVINFGEDEPCRIVFDSNAGNIEDYDYKGIILPKDATNGDMIKAMFPNSRIHVLSLDWWNKPYKAESENKFS